MVKVLTTLIFLSIVIISCQEHKETKYFWVRYRHGAIPKVYTTDILKVENGRLEDLTRISYHSNVRTVNFIFLDKHKDKALINYSSDNTLINGSVCARLLLDTTILINRDTLNVRKYLADDLGEDGARTYYYSPQLGVFAIHSGPWPSIICLRTDDLSINKKINRLILATVPNRLIRDKLLKDLKI